MAVNNSVHPPNPSISVVSDCTSVGLCLSQRSQADHSIDELGAGRLGYELLPPGLKRGAANTRALAAGQRAVLRLLGVVGLRVPRARFPVDAHC